MSLPINYCWTSYWDAVVYDAILRKLDAGVHHIEVYVQKYPPPEEGQPALAIRIDCRFGHKTYIDSVTKEESTTRNLVALVTSAAERIAMAINDELRSVAP